MLVSKAGVQGMVNSQYLCMCVFVYSVVLCVFVYSIVLCVFVYSIMYVNNAIRHKD